MVKFSRVAGARGRALLALASLGIAISLAAACAQDGGTDVGKAQQAQSGPTPPTAGKPGNERAAGYGPSDTSRAVLQHGPTVQISHAESSPPFATAPNLANEEEEEEDGREHRPLKAPRTYLPVSGLPFDPIAQMDLPVVGMPATVLSFAGQSGTTGSYPPDTNGVVGPNHFVQAVNTNIEIWNKNGTVAQASKAFRTLWAGYVGTNAGNGCATNNDGDPVVVYDQLADRWFLTQFSLPNTGTVAGPSFQCVAVSKTGDPTGAYWLYDFKYAYSINDYGKFGIWPDGYYATFNIFDSNPDPAIQFDFKGADFCAYDRVKMLAGQPAAQQCFVQPFPVTAACPTDGGPPPVEPFQVGGALPISLDGKIPPPRGAPGYFMQFDYSQCGPTYNQVDVWAAHLDWTTPANSTLTGPTVVQVANFTPTCYSKQGADCVPEKGGALLAGLDDRVMFRFTYRNFGTHQSLLVNHSVATGATGGVRWYELRLPSGVPTLFQQGTYAPSDANWRWMASLAQDMAQDMALGYSISSTTTNPSIAWTGRTVGDPAGTMGQAEAVIDVGAGNQTMGRWGDYSNMTVDPVDDCTFWYTQELYATNGSGNWRTFVATTKFPSCGANNFSISLAPAAQTVADGATTTFTVTTASTAGTAESIALNVQDLPTGVTGAFVPATVTAGNASTLTLTAAAAAPAVANVTFTVIGKAPSAVHAATALVSVVAASQCGNGVVNAGEQCDDGVANGTATDCCSATCQFQSSAQVCRPAASTCDVAETCSGSAAACPVDGKQPNGTVCADGNACTQTDTCQAGVCTGGNPVVCTALDECHTVGVCAPATGVCSQPTKPDGTACSIGTCVGGTCTAGPADGGTDAGSDAGSDAGPGTDGGTDAGTDSGAKDSGPGTDSGAKDSGTDSGTPDVDSGPGPGTDSGAPSDSGSGGGDATADGGDNGGTGDSGGCGCRTVPTGTTPSWAFAGAGGLALLLARRRRRR